ncbi:D-TA family PLP-dependent enzyme [Pinibacter aurantiacus]|uniref:D-TA family PLP-dependent enzyme n=1 Tax=Pinibacter aurantiacus TaxID=2851599 RepID=A0A9E2W915_9BACT|nr:D-TA family PLP-dependent enzyme [Pinibacter aurantiacus]MBV4359012.1 D-TA family PLP-dependent enzyme [Pinibacter aurantiacus]
MTTKNWFNIADSSTIDSPALIFYADRMRENVKLLTQMIGDPSRLRPHVKTHKTKEATQMMMDEGITKFKCATIAEAEMLGMVQAPDVLLAYQPVGPKLQRFISLVKNYPATKYSCLVDDRTIAETISYAAISENIVIPVFIDLNVGMNRTGISPGNEAIDLYRHITSLKGISFAGLHFYDGHIKEIDLEKRRSECNEILSSVRQLKTAITDSGHKGNLQLIGGGSPSFPVYANEQDVECSPGTFIFWDKGYTDGLPEQKFLTAALVITRVVSLPAEGLICVDMGHKAIAAENMLANRFSFLNAPELTPVGQSEEHLVLKTNGAHSWKIGDLLYALPMHVCPTVALYRNAVVIENAAVAASWSIIARDRKICY